MLPKLVSMTNVVSLFFFAQVPGWSWSHIFRTCLVELVFRFFLEMSVFFQTLIMERLVCSSNFENYAGPTTHSFVYTSGHCRRWRSRMEVKIMAGSLFVHCKIAYFYSVTAEKWLIVSLPNFVTIRRIHFHISCKIFSWICSTKLKIHAMEFSDFIKDSVSPSGLFVPCSLTVTSTWRPRLTAHCPIGERH